MAVIQRVAKANGVTVKQVMGRSRLKPIARARQMAMRAIEAEFGDSSPMIGRLFNRDHTTVLAALGSIKKRVPVDIRDSSTLPFAGNETMM
jgi:chromosomal replication initiator protein